MPRRLALALVALAACQRPATQIVLRVDSDLRPGVELRAVQVRARRAGAEGLTVDRSFDLAAGALSMPGTVTLVSGDPDDARRLEVEVRAVLADGDFATRAVVTFQRERALRLDVFLAARCRDEANRAGCGPDETCGPDGCEPIRRPWLPDLEEPVDAAPVDVAREAAPDVDAAVEPDAPAEDVAPDASDDVAVEDSTVPDVAAPDVAAPDVPAPDVPAPDVPAPDVAGPCGAPGEPCCAGGACAAAGGACSRVACVANRCALTNLPDDTACGAARVGGWSACAYSSVCDRYGSEQRAVESPRCRAGACRVVTTTETRACSRATDGLACASTAYGAWGACGGYTSTCDSTGTRSRTVTAYRCASGNCAPSASTASESCGRTTTGQSCTWTLSGRSCPGRCASSACEPTCGRVGCPC